MNHCNNSDDFLHSMSSHKYVQGHARPWTSQWPNINKQSSEPIFSKFDI